MSSNKVLYEVGTRVQTVEPPYYTDTNISDVKIGEAGKVIKISIHSRNRNYPIILYSVRFDNDIVNQYLDRALKKI